MRAFPRPIRRPARSDRAPKSDVNIRAKVFAVLFQLPRKLGDCGESARGGRKYLSRAINDEVP